MTEPSPSEVEGKKDIWLLEGLEEAEERIEEYVEKNEIGPPEDMTEDDLEENELENKTDIDVEAINTRYLSGKWIAFIGPERADEVWKVIKRCIADNDIWGAKITTSGGRKARKEDKHMLIVYTPNYLAKDDVFRVRDILEDRCDIEAQINYRPDIYNMVQVNEFNFEQMGLESQYRYTG